MTSLTNKVIVITGGTAGIGKALANASQQAGAQTIVIARNAQRLQQLTEESRGALTGIQGDVTDDASIQQAIEQILAEFGRIDVWVNNVGKSCRGEAQSTEVDKFREFFDINFLTAVRCTNLVLEYLKRSKGTLVNIGSLASKTGGFFMGPYPASKFPLAAYSHQLRLELETDGVHVLLVCPGPVARDDDSPRYHMDESLPQSASLPAGGVKITRLCPDKLAHKILKAIAGKKRELILPKSAKWLFAISQLSPRFGDWIIKRRSKRS